MHQMNVSVIGVAVTAVRTGTTEAGQAMARFRMVCRPRKFDAVTGRVTEFDPSFVNVQCWRQLAEHVAASIGKGDPVVVTGRLRVREWEQDGRVRVSVEIDAQSIGHDLNRGTTRFERAGAARHTDGGQLGASSSAKAEPPAPVADDDGPRDGGQCQEVA